MSSEQQRRSSDDGRRVWRTPPTPTTTHPFGNEHHTIPDGRPPQRPQLASPRIESIDRSCSFQSSILTPRFTTAADRHHIMHSSRGVRSQAFFNLLELRPLLALPALFQQPHLTMRTVTALVAALGLLVQQAAAFMPASSGLRGKLVTSVRPRRSIVVDLLYIYTSAASALLPG